MLDRTLKEATKQKPLQVSIYLQGLTAFVWSGRELNPRHMDFQSIALPTELPDHSPVRRQVTNIRTSGILRHHFDVIAGRRHRRKSQLRHPTFSRCHIPVMAVPTLHGLVRVSRHCPVFHPATTTTSASAVRIGQTFHTLPPLTLLPSGRKYHERTVRTSSRTGGKISPMPSPTTMRENSAPDMAKKKPA